MCQLNKLYFKDYVLASNKLQKEIIVSYQLFGQPLHTAPIVLVNHALTGNSQICGKNGWFDQLIGENKTIDTHKFTLISFNIPGNAYLDDQNNIANYQDFTVQDIACIFWKALQSLKIDTLFAVFGGSLGGAIAWEMLIQYPNKIKHLIPVATSWKSSDWLIANVLIQDLILNNSKNPVHDARIHAMLLYRTPESLKQKFDQKMQENSKDQLYQVESWLLNHGNKLQNRFQLDAYKLMNHLLKTIDVFRQENLESTLHKIEATVHFIAVNTDYFFTKNEIKQEYNILKKIKKNTFYHEIKSIHGHDAFLIEFEQLNKFLNPIFN